MASRRSPAPTYSKSLVASHPRTRADWVWADGTKLHITAASSAERDLYHETHCKLRSSAAVGKYAPPKMSSPKGDLHILSDIEDDSRSRFAEPREGEEMLIPQRRSFGACSGFLMDTCPLGTRRNQVTYYMALIGVLQWEAAWLRRDAIASYVSICLGVDEAENNS